jgi:hypothetical protein
MGKLERVIVRGTILGILTLALTSTSFAAVSSQAEWDTYLADKCGTGNNVECLLGFSSGYDDSQHRLAWHGHYWLRAFVSMAQTYQDSKYLDYAVSMIDYMLYYRDDVRAARGDLDVLQEPYVKAPPFYLNNRDLAAPCWRHKKDCKTILDGQITSGIMHFVRLVKESGSFGAYEATADNYLVSVLETLSIWDETYVYLPSEYNGGATGSYFWPREDGTGLYKMVLVCMQRDLCPTISQQLFSERRCWSTMSWAPSTTEI